MNKKMQAKTNIKTRFIPVLGLFMIWFLMLARVEAQPKVSLENRDVCSGEVLLALEVTDFEDVAAFTIYIEIDTAVLDLVKLGNAHAGLESGNLDGGVNYTEQMIVITWFSLTPLNIEEGKLCDLQLDLKKGYSPLDFTSSSELNRSDLSTIENVSYINGSLFALGSLEINPWTNEIEPGEDASFVLPSYSEYGYQWQEKRNGEEWVNLNDADRYSGTQTNVLHLNSVPASYNGYQYRCLISNDECTDPTKTARLSVKVGLDENAPRNSLLKVYPNPAQNHLTYNIKGVHDLTNLKVYLSDIHGRILIRENALSEMNNKLDLEFLPEGCYFLQLLQNDRIMETIKILHH